jgi:hypothetical protein
MTPRLKKIAASFLTLAIVCPVAAGCARHSKPETPAEAAAPSSSTARETGDWTKTLAVPPGSSLPRRGTPLAQVITLFEMSDARMVGERYFVTGTGYVEIDGGGRHFAGPNRKMDPYLEVTIARNNWIALDECRRLLVKHSFSDKAVRISGTGFFASKAGVAGRQLGILRLDRLSGCKLVARN